MQPIKNFIIYRASAGSGKTWMLVKEYLRLALKSGAPSAYKGILAITFTNKAAGEMKDRVLKRLWGFSSGSDDDLFDEAMAKVLCEDLSISHEELKSRSTITLTHMIHHYGDVAICTIDSFMHKLVRSFARDLSLEPDFNVELNNDEVLTEAVNKVLAEAGANKQLTDFLLKFVLQRVENEKSWGLQDELVKFSKLLLKEEANQNLKALGDIDLDGFSKIIKSLDEKIAEFEAPLIDLADRALHLISQTGVSKSDFSYRGGAVTYFENCADRKFSLPGTQQSKVFSGEGSWVATKADDITRSKIENIQDELTTLANSIVEILETSDVPLYKTRLKMKSNIFSFGLLTHVQKAIGDWKEENRTILIQDFNRLIASLILKNPAAFIYERLGARYKHFLIDEFQDTSVMQWQNFLPLVENSLAYGMQTIIVGDGKQSIYRWRNGEVEQFNDLPDSIFKRPDNLFRELERTIQREGERKELKRNFRSLKEIVSFNNDLYEHLGPLTGDLSGIYDEHDQNEVRNGSGYVNVSVVEGEKSDDKKEAMNAYCLKAINESISDGYYLSDISILVRRKDESDLIAAFVQSNGFDVTTDESFKLSNHPAVRFLVASIIWLTEAQENTWALQILSSYSEMNEQNTSLHELLKTYSERRKKETYIDLIPFFSNLGIGKTSVSGLSIFEQVRFMLDQLQIDGLKENAYVTSLLELLHEKGKKHNDHLSISEWWQEASDKASLNASGSANSIRIMTIHKSKGLQFPVVILPVFEQYDKSDNLWFEKGDPESGLPIALVNASGKASLELANPLPHEFEKKRLDVINLLYVATTRPEDRLYVGLVKGNQDLGLAPHKILIYGLEQAFDFDGRSLEIGKRKSVVRDDEQLPTQPLEDSGLFFRKKVRIASSGRPKESSEDYSAQDYGLWLHEVLSKIRTFADLDVLESRLRTSDIPGEHQVQLMNDAKTIARLPELSTYFDDGVEVINEFEVINENGKALRPDRVVFTSEEVVVIDYKTGAPQKSHENQVREYAALIQDIENRPVKSVLVYTDELNVVEVQD